MARPPKLHKEPTTTISISKSVWNHIKKNKWKGMTMDQFTKKILVEWADHKENSQILEIRIELLQKQKKDYEHTLDDLKSIAGVQTIEELKSKLYALIEQEQKKEQTIYVAN